MARFAGNDSGPRRAMRNAGPSIGWIADCKQMSDELKGISPESTAAVSAIICVAARWKASGGLRAKAVEDAIVFKKGFLQQEHSTVHCCPRATPLARLAMRLKECGQRRWRHSWRLPTKFFRLRAKLFLPGRP